MAAPSSKQSPSNQKMHESSSSSSTTTITAAAIAETPSGMLKDPPPVAKPAEDLVVVRPLTYRASETSESYKLAKQLLNRDDFEGALNVIEEALHQTTTDLRESVGLSGNSDAADSSAADDADTIDLETEIQMHQALAPLHYLYGTTLLYSLEEARDDGANNNSNSNGDDNSNPMTMMMTEAGAKAASGSSNNNIDDNDVAGNKNPWAGLGGDASPQADTPPVAAAADLEDIHIAWENLEAARTIVERMLTGGGGGMDANWSDHEVAKLQLDLAQIHLREGDLQRINGNYTSAVGDYSTCLETLMRYNHTFDEDKNHLRELDRKVADTQYNLGLTYLTSSSDLQKEVASADPPNATAKEKSEASEHRRKAGLLAREHCSKGIRQHFECARTFCRILAKLCGVAPESLLDETLPTTETVSNETKTPVVAGLKTTGLDDEEDQAAAPTTTSEATISKTLNVWREKVAALVQSFTKDREDDHGLLDIVMVLDEIQETIDEAGRSQEAVLQAATIRVKAQQAATTGDGTVSNPDGSTTTIGFGQPSSSSVAAAAATTVKQQEADADAASDAKPMMVVKKKKKRKDVESIEEESKKGAPEDDSAQKRPKTTA